MTTWTLRPGIAASLDLKSSDGSWDTTIIYLSEEKGAVYSSRDYLVSQSNLPLEIKAAINGHFTYVFSLAHEDWKEKGPSPRAMYCDALQPWTIETPDST
jgi:hypothetical protein